MTKLNAHRNSASKMQKYLPGNSPIINSNTNRQFNFFEFRHAELRNELRKHGLPNLPVTETTRNLLLKKLKNCILNESLEKKRKRRETLMSLPSANINNDIDKKRRTQSPARRSVATSGSPARRNSPNVSQLDSPIYAFNNSTPSISRNFYLSNGASSYIAKSYDPKFGNLPQSSHNYEAGKKSSPRIYVPPPIIANDVQAADGPYVPKTSSPIAHDTDRQLKNGLESPSVVSRLLKLRDITIRRGSISPIASNSTYSNNLYLSDSDSDNSISGRYITTSKRINNRPLTKNVFSSFNLKHKFKQLSVPYVLVSSFGLFFAVLAFLYMTKPPDIPSTMLETSTAFTTCNELKESSVMPKSSINCIDNDLVVNSIALNRELMQLLQIKTETHFCKDRSVSPEVSGTDFMKYLYKKRATDAHKLLRCFHAALYLIEKNPQWKIAIFNKSDDGTLFDIYKQDVRFGLLKPYLPLKCIFLNKIQRVFVIIGTVFLLLMFLFLCNAVVRYFRQRYQNRILLMDNLTKDIIKELMCRASLNDETGGEVIICHLRDKLIPINKRRSLLSAWNEAIRKLELNDSRVQFGVIVRNGEEFRTMKWGETLLAPMTHSPMSMHLPPEERSRKKQWQSPAFDNVNNTFEPPTPCLKVRHMFHAAEANQPDLQQNITESILEKVGPQCKIYDIQLDRQSCCVYIRCASEKDAGIVHNEINGWWFDNHLVSIKFLRLQRYLARFPHSNTTPITMRSIK
uniref:LEM domain-containing protein n=1 Tax=Glossina brevipalpis TaxID=37001 RepID=A0A1A9WP79_9MUSC